MEKTFELEHSQTDYKGNLKMSELFTEFALIATDHAISFGGWDPKYKDSHGGIISKMRVKVKQPVRIGENITLKEMQN